ncbi:cytochrome c oxidase subunit I [Glycocaulis sp.]
MSRIPPISLHRALDAAWRVPRGFAALSAVNHSVVGRRFIITAFIFFAIGGILAMLIRAQLARPDSPFLGADAYNQIFTMHGTVMMFLFAIPLIEGIALYLLPKIIGGRDLSYPRLSAFGYWCYLFGGTIILVSMLMGVAPDSGWFMYTPLASSTYTPGINADVWLLGITFVEISAICAAVEIVVTILKVRTAGMSLTRMPLMGWYLLVTAGMMLIAFPPLILASVLLEIERAFNWPFFDPERGGAALLWQHLFWLFGHPEVYIIFLPAAGAVTTLIPVFARTKIVGYAWIVAAIIALAFLSFGLWVHHMFTVGIPHLALAFFSAASMLVAVPTAIQVFAWIATLMRGRPQMRLPMLYLMGFFSVFILGGLTGVMLALVPFNWQAHDTHFVVAHLHYVLIGGFVFPMMAAAYYWLPLMTGRLPVFSVSKTAFWLIFIGFNVTFLIMHFTGLMGMPRRIYTYEAGLGWDLPNLISSIGGFVMTAGFALFVLDIVLQVKFGRRFRRNPWGGTGIDWAMPTPAPSYNFASLPLITSRDPLEDNPRLGADIAAGKGYLAGAPRGRMETLCVDMVSGEPDHVLELPNNDYTPFWMACGLAVFFTLFLLGFYAQSAIGLVIATVFGWRWLWSIGAKADPDPIDVGHGAVLPLQYAARSVPTLLGLKYFLAANAAFFGSLVFGYIFLWTTGPDWPPPEFLDADPLRLAMLVAGLAGAGVLARLARRANDKGDARWRALGLAGSALASLLTLGGLAALAFTDAPSPVSHAYGAITMAVIGYVMLHVLLGVLFSVYGLARSRFGYVSPVRSADMRGVDIWQAYAAITGLAALALITLMPGAFG